MPTILRSQRRRLITAGSKPDQLEKVTSFFFVGTQRRAAFCGLACVSADVSGLCRIYPFAMDRAAGYQPEKVLWLGLSFHADLEYRRYLVGLELHSPGRRGGHPCQ